MEWGGRLVVRRCEENCSIQVRDGCVGGVFVEDIVLHSVVRVANWAVMVSSRVSCVMGSMIENHWSSTLLEEETALVFD